MQQICSCTIIVWTGVARVACNDQPLWGRWIGIFFPISTFLLFILHWRFYRLVSFGLDLVVSCCWFGLYRIYGIVSCVEYFSFFFPSLSSLVLEARRRSYVTQACFAEGWILGSISAILNILGLLIYQYVGPFYNHLFKLPPRVNTHPFHNKKIMIPTFTWAINNDHYICVFLLSLVSWLIQYSGNLALTNRFFKYQIRDGVTRDALEGSWGE